MTSSMKREPMIARSVFAHSSTLLIAAIVFSEMPSSVPQRLKCPAMLGCGPRPAHNIPSRKCSCIAVSCASAMDNAVFPTPGRPFSAVSATLPPLQSRCCIRPSSPSRPTRAIAGLIGIAGSYIAPPCAVAPPSVVVLSTTSIAPLSVVSLFPIPATASPPVAILSPTFHGVPSTPGLMSNSCSLFPKRAQSFRRK